MSNFVNLMDIIYPVGSLYLTTNSVSPVDSIGGTWVKLKIVYSRLAAMPTI